MSADEIKASLPADAIADDLKVKKTIDLVREKAVVTDAAPKKAPAKKTASTGAKKTTSSTTAKKTTSTGTKKTTSSTTAKKTTSTGTKKTTTAKKAAEETTEA